MHCHSNVKTLQVDFFQFSPMFSCYCELSNQSVLSAEVLALAFSYWIQGSGPITSSLDGFT